MCDCKFYEVDLDAQRETEEMEASRLAYFDGMSEEAREAWEEERDALAECGATDSTHTDDTALARCGAFCKHLACGTGFPGETMYCCIVPGHEHVIHVDFDESAVR